MRPTARAPRTWRRRWRRVCRGARARATPPPSTQSPTRPHLGREVFARGLPEPIAEIKKPEWSATLYDLLSAYASQRQKQARAFVRLPKRAVWSLSEAREAVER